MNGHSSSEEEAAWANEGADNQVAPPKNKRRGKKKQSTAVSFAIDPNDPIEVEMEKLLADARAKNSRAS